MGNGTDVIVQNVVTKKEKIYQLEFSAMVEYMAGVTDVFQNLRSLQTTTEQALGERGLDLTTCQSLGLKSLTQVGGIDKVAQPYIRENKVYAYKIRPVIGKGDHFWIGGEGKGQYFFNEDALRNYKDEPLIITEGEFDSICLIGCGYKRVVSVPNGANEKSIPIDDPSYNTAFPYLENAMNLLIESNIPYIIICTDGDKAGQTLREDLALRLGKARCRFIEYPLKRDSEERCKDINEVAQQWGERGVHRVIEKAKWFPINGVYRLSDLPTIEEPTVFRANFGNLDKHLGLRLGDFSVCTGIPGHGKSTFVNDYMCRMIEKHGLKVGFASFEQPPQTDHKRNLVRWYTGKATGNNFEFISNDELKKAEKWIDDNVRFIIKEDEEDATIDWVLDRMRACVIQHDVDIIVLDPYNEIDHKKSGDQSSTDYVGDAIKKLKRFAKNYKVHVMVVAHPTKLTPKDQDGNLPIPTPYHIEDSRHWNNKSDQAIIVYRQKNTTLIRVAKSRYHEILGPTGNVLFYFGTDNGRYYEAEDIEEID